MRREVGSGVDVFKFKVLGEKVGGVKMIFTRKIFNILTKSFKMLSLSYKSHLFTLLVYS